MCVRSTPRGNSEGRSKSREQCPAVDQRGRWRCLYSLLPIGRALLHSWKGADENALRILLSQYHVRKWCRSPLLKCRRSLSLDRKSTRLNSSHSQISYAVFCLKKKSR